LLDFGDLSDLLALAGFGVVLPSTLGSLFRT
jgi:hypothetical protein